MTITDYELNDFRRLFEQDETRFDVDDFVEYVRTHDYTTDYASLKTGFICKQLAEEQSDYQEKQRRDAEEIFRQAEAAYLERARQLEAAAKRRALQEYIDAGFLPESFEDDWAADQDPPGSRQDRRASPRHQPPRPTWTVAWRGGRSGNVAPSSQG